MVNYSQIKSTFLLRIFLILGLILPASLPAQSSVSAQAEMAQFSNSHILYTSEFGVTDPQGMAFSPGADAFIVWGAGESANIITMQEDALGRIDLSQRAAVPLNVAFDEQSNDLFMLDGSNRGLSKIGAKQDGMPDTSSRALTHYDVSAFDLQDAQGMTFDPASGRLFLLDANRFQILIVSPHPTRGFDGASAAENNNIRQVSLRSTMRGAVLRGVAFNPGNGHLYIGSPGERRIYEVSEKGELLSTYDTSELPLENPSTLLFAPSRDTTDDPNIMDLYVLDSGQTATRTSTSTDSGQIVELSLQFARSLPPGTTVLQSAVVNMIDTSNAAWNPSSPDPSGIDYWPLTGNLLISDSEVEEMPIYAGANVFETTTTGTLVDTCNTLSFSHEPSGLATNPDNSHIFFSDDDGSNDKIIEVNVGADATYCTADDVRTITNAAVLYGATDAEDVAYGNNTVFISDGMNGEVYVVPLGANGILGGGDDGASSHFDTAALGFSDLEGIDYNPENGTLFIVSTKGTENYLGEVTTSGTLLRGYNLSFMGVVGNLRSDVSYAPSSLNPALNNIYIVSRGVDNGSDPNENDGKVWEINISGPGAAPTVSSVVRANASPTDAAHVDYTVTFSEKVSGVNLSDFTLTTTGVSGAEINGVSGSGSTYTVTVNTGSGDGTIRLDVLDDNSILDAVGSPLNGGFTSGQVYTIEKNVPSVISITRANSNPTDALSVDYTILFSEPVTGVDGSDFTLTTTGVSGTGINGVSGSDSTYTVTVNTGTGDGTILLDVLDDNTIVNTFGNSLLSGFTGGEVYTVIKSSPFADAQVSIAGVSQGSYHIAPHYNVKTSYAGVDNGPVRVKSMTNGVKIVASERVAYFDGSKWTSHSELMGLPVNRLHTSYTFPWYNNLNLNSQLRFANVGTADTQVKVLVAGQLKGTYNLSPNQSQEVSYAGLEGGPVVIQSTTTVKIAASMRVSYTDGTNITNNSEMMGLPTNKLATGYAFPWYNNVGLDSQLRFANVGTAQTTVTVKIGNLINQQYTLQPGQVKRVKFAGVDKGPVRVTSSGGVKIIASMRVSYFDGTNTTSYSEMMGLPLGSLSTHFSFPAYDNVLHDTQVRFANMGTTQTTVKVTINSVLQGTYTLGANAVKRVSFPGVDNGPVVVESSGGVKILASVRVAYVDGGVTTSYAEMMGLPLEQLSTTYFFPFYDNVTIDTQLRFAVP
jgi:hypothetical protein